MSKLMAFVAPIPEEKFQQWKQFKNKLNNENRKEFQASRKSL